MVDPQRLGEDTTVFVSGDDPDAKATVTELLRAIGHGDVIDLGGIETARGPEMYITLWIRTDVGARRQRLQHQGREGTVARRRMTGPWLLEPGRLAIVNQTE